MRKVNSSGFDFIYWLGIDISMKILTYLDDPSDLVRVSSVSKLWHQFVIENGLSRQLCFKRFPEITSASQGIELKNMIEVLKSGTGNSKGVESWDSWEFLKRNNRIYSFLAQGLSRAFRNDCVSIAISASSTDHYPTEGIQNTLEARDRLENGMSSYWSSAGESDPDVPETLLYKLSSRLCVVTEIHIQPFRAYFQFGFPIYSCKAVRFRMGHVKDHQVELESAIVDNGFVAHDDGFVWTYVSPEFPMSQASVLQKFELPEPALCIGGFLLVELLGREQRQDIDGLYYICISHVQAVGRPLSPSFDVEMLSPSGKCRLKYYPKTESPESSPLRSPTREVGESSQLRTMLSRFVSNSLRTIISIPPTFYDDDESEDENSNSI